MVKWSSKQEYELVRLVPQRVQTSPRVFRLSGAATVSPFRGLVLSRENRTDRMMDSAADGKLEEESSYRTAAVVDDFDNRNKSHLRRQRVSAWEQGVRMNQYRDALVHPDKRQAQGLNGQAVATLQRDADAMLIAKLKKQVVFLEEELEKWKKLHQNDTNELTIKLEKALVEGAMYKSLADASIKIKERGVEVGTQKEVFVLHKYCETEREEDAPVEITIKCESAAQTDSVSGQTLDLLQAVVEEKPALEGPKKVLQALLGFNRLWPKVLAAWHEVMRKRRWQRILINFFHKKRMLFGGTPIHMVGPITSP
ncbi:hypothetical protein CYMTET_26337 [Cymbomonas tetramitiformis]|uniref:Uncharacterized protein n=1 Tax=Cymbomonas tetramitiformis TaxID=36881 RepID=A0AAE0KYB8_9CHLO|nr:hypothetical protein CYMTET_26337 [Cymbomonas tetramitiformis]